MKIWFNSRKFLGNVKPLPNVIISFEKLWPIEHSSIREKNNYGMRRENNEKILGGKFR